MLVEIGILNEQALASCASRYVRLIHEDSNPYQIAKPNKNPNLIVMPMICYASNWLLIVDMPKRIFIVETLSWLAAVVNLN